MNQNETTRCTAENMYFHIEYSQNHRRLLTMRVIDLRPSCTCNDFNLLEDSGYMTVFGL
jgi:hypothetical protein